MLRRREEVSPARQNASVTFVSTPAWGVGVTVYHTSEKEKKKKKIGKPSVVRAKLLLSANYRILNPLRLNFEQTKRFRALYTITGLATTFDGPRHPERTEVHPGRCHKDRLLRASGTDTPREDTRERGPRKTPIGRVGGTVRRESHSSTSGPASRPLDNRP